MLWLRRLGGLVRALRRLPQMRLKHPYATSKPHHMAAGIFTDYELVLAVLRASIQL